jgi:hypothetical protein
MENEGVQLIMKFDADLVEEFSDEEGNEVMKMILQKEFNGEV